MKKKDVDEAINKVINDVIKVSFDVDKSETEDSYELLIHVHPNSIFSILLDTEELEELETEIKKAKEAGK